MLDFLSCLLDDNDSVTNSCKCCVSVKIIYDKDSGRSRGFGFVHFSKEDDAESAKHAMDGKVSKELCFLELDGIFPITFVKTETAGYHGFSCRDC